MTRLTVWGAAYITAVSLMPQAMVQFFNALEPGGTLLLITVEIMDFGQVRP